MKTIKSEKIGDADVRLIDFGKEFKGVIFVNGEKKSEKRGDDPEALWNVLKAAAYKENPNYFGYEEAQKAFIKFFPEGFSGKNYNEKEREYKFQASAFLNDNLPLETAIEKPLEDATKILIQTFQKTNMLSPYEKMWVKEALLSDDAKSLIEGFVNFTKTPNAQTLSALAVILKNHNAAKWTIVTYLPFMWRPNEHMYLKPTILKDFAERVGHGFTQEYGAGLDFSVYESLLDLANQTESEIEALSPQDRIDIQSFIWTISKYSAEDMPESEV